MGGMFHGVLKSTNLARAGNPPRQLDDSVRDRRNHHIERLAGVADCDDCDGDGYLLDDNDIQCWHGKEPA